MSGSRALSGVVALPLVAAALGMGLRVVDHAEQDVYGIPGWGVTLTIVLSVVVLAGAALIFWSRRPGLSALVLAGTALGALGLLAIASIGLLVLLIAGGLLARVAARDWSGPRRVPAAAGAVLAGLPLPLLAVFALSGPLVVCGSDGASGGENVFMALSSGGGGSAGSITSSPAGSGSGREQGGSYSYSYACEDGELVRFDLRWR